MFTMMKIIFISIFLDKSSISCRNLIDSSRSNNHKKIYWLQISYIDCLLISNKLIQYEFHLRHIQLNFDSLIVFSPFMNIIFANLHWNKNPFYKAMRNLKAIFRVLNYSWVTMFVFYNALKIHSQAAAFTS